MQMSIIEVFKCSRLHTDTSMTLICIWLVCRLCTILHTKCCGVAYDQAAARWWQTCTIIRRVRHEVDDEADVLKYLQRTLCAWIPNFCSIFQILFYNVYTPFFGGVILDTYSTVLLRERMSLCKDCCVEDSSDF